VFNVFSATNPIVGGDIRAIKLAPYNATYHNMAEHLATTGNPIALSSSFDPVVHRQGLLLEPPSAESQGRPVPNYWNFPVDVNTLGLVTHTTGTIRKHDDSSKDGEDGDGITAVITAMELGEPLQTHIGQW